MVHEGARSSKLTFLGSKDKLVSVGFTRQSQRQFKIWDPRNLTKEVRFDWHVTEAGWLKADVYLFCKKQHCVAVTVLPFNVPARLKG